MYADIRYSMALLAEFTLPPAAFPLGRLFETRPEATLELDRVVPTADTVMPYFWVHSSDGEMAAVAAVFADLPELRSARLIDDLGTDGLFRAEWEPEYIGIMGAVAAAGVTVIAASGSNEGWRFEIRAESSDQLAEFQQLCAAEELPVTLGRLQRLTVDDDTGLLTDEQREALLAAYEAGYYAEPRETDLASVATTLDITRQALAARLRRAYRTLIEDAVAEAVPRDS